MFSKWKISLPGAELYRFGENGELYRLPFCDNEKKRSYGLRRIRPYRGGWMLSLHGKQKYWSKDQIRQHILIDENPIELTYDMDMPF